MSRFKLDKLAEQAREQLIALLRDGWSIDDITEVAQELAAAEGMTVARASVGRWVQHHSKTMQTFQKAQGIAKVWVDRIEAEPDGDVARLLPQMLSAVAYQTIDSMGESDKKTKVSDVMLMAKAIKDISGTMMSQAQLELKMREVRDQARLKALDDAAKVVGETARAQGMDETQVDFWRRKVLGVK